MKAERYLRTVDAYLDRLVTAFEASANSADAEIQPGRKRLILHGVGEPTPEVTAIMREAPSITISKRKAAVMEPLPPFRDSRTSPTRAMPARRPPHTAPADTSVGEPHE